MSSTFSSVEVEKPRRLIGAKSLVVTGGALAAAAPAANAQFIVNTTSINQNVGAGAVNVGSLGGSSTVNLGGLSKINIASQDLIGVTFSYSGGISQSATVSVGTSTSAATGTISFNDSLSLTSNSGLFTGSLNPPSLTNVTSSQTCTNSAVFVVIDGIGYYESNSCSATNSATESGAANSYTTSLLNVQSPGLGGFTGTGTLGMSLTLQDNSNYSGAGGLSSFDVQNQAGSVTLAYTYLTGSDTGHLLQNGSFELPAQIEQSTTHGAYTGGAYLYGSDSAATGLSVSAPTLNAVPGIGWSFNGTSGIAHNNSSLFLTNAGTGGSDGDQAAFITGGANMSQNFTSTSDGKHATDVYKLTFVAEQSLTNSSNESIEVLVNGQVLTASLNKANVGQTGYNSTTGLITPNTSTAWSSYTLYTNALAPGQSYSVEFLGEGGNTVFIDSVSLTNAGYVPGPESLLVMGSATPLMLLSLRRRRSRKSA